MRKRMAGMDRFGRIMRTVLIIANVVFLVLGIVLIGTGVFFIAERLYFTSPVFGIPIIAASAYFFLAAGIVLVIISFLGCLGALYEKRSLLFFYTLCLCVTFMLIFTAASLAIVFRSWLATGRGPAEKVREQVITYMTEIIQKTYGVNLTNPYNAWVTSSWDAAQQREDDGRDVKLKWYCCGVYDKGWNVYRSSKWYFEQPGIPESTRPYVPESCCIKDQYGRYLNLQKCQLFLLGPPARQGGSTTFNECLFYKGCYDAGKDSLYSISTYIIVFGLISALLILVGMSLSINLYRRV